MSFVVTATAFLVALGLLQHGYAELVGPGKKLTGALGALAALGLLALGTFFAGRSTLGARATGPLLMLASLPALLRGAWPTMPGAAQLMQWLPNDPPAWGSSRPACCSPQQDGESTWRDVGAGPASLVGLKSAESATPAGGIARV